MAIRAPQGLRESESKLWRRVVDEFGRENLEPSDTSLVLGLALLYGRLDDIRTLLYTQQQAESAEGDAKREMPYLLERTVRGMTTNPLIAHERETIKEIRLLHERLSKIIDGRTGSRDGPASLSAMRRRLEDDAPRPRQRPRAV